MAKGALATTAIEGNTLSEKEVLQVLDGTLKLPPSREYLKQEIDDVAAAFDKIRDQVATGTLAPLTVAEFEAMNAQILKGLRLSEEVIPGKIRTHDVGVSRYRAVPAEDCAYLLNKLAEWMEGDDLKGPPDMRIIYGIIRAVMAHLYFAWIHPFGDGNGRTARLIEYRILLSCGVPSPAVHLLSNHYSLTRSEYYRQLDRASGSKGEYIPFMEYAVQGFVDGLRQQLSEIREFQLDVIWRNYLHELFGDRKSEIDRRRRRLALVLSESDKRFKMAEIRKLPGLPTDYLSATRMVLNRDLNELKKMGLVTRTSQGSKANKQIVEAFLPFRVTNSPGEAEESEA
jgi:Fic family protein